MKKGVRAVALSIAFLAMLAVIVTAMIAAAKNNMVFAIAIVFVLFVIAAITLQVIAEHI